MNVGDIVIPIDPKKDKVFSKTCGRVAPLIMSSFIGKPCKMIFVARDGTASIENPDGAILWWTLKHLTSPKK